MQIKKTILIESATLEELRKIIREGRAAEVLAVGDQIYIDFYAIPVIKMNTNSRKTLDTFFLLSVVEYDAKDTPYEYYKDKRYRAAKHAKDDFNDWHRTRSAARGDSYLTWCVDSSGGVDNNGADNSMRCAPACAIG